VGILRHIVYVLSTFGHFYIVKRAHLLRIFCTPVTWLLAITVNYNLV